MYLSPSVHRALVDQRCRDQRSEAERRRLLRRRSHVGEQFVSALAARDRAGLLDVLHPELDFRAMHENSCYHAASAAQVVDGLILGRWFEPADDVDVESIVLDPIGDRAHLRYRLRVARAEQVFRVNQRAYLDRRAERIVWMSIMCSGKWPARRP